METTDKAKTLGRVGENYAAKWLFLYVLCLVHALLEKINQRIA